MIKNNNLSTQDLANILSVNESTIKRWADSGSLKCYKTLGGHRKFNLKDVMEFSKRYSYDASFISGKIIENKLKISDDLESIISKKDYTKLCDYLELLLIKNYREDVFYFIILLYFYKISLADLYDFIIKPVQSNIGYLWEINKLGIDEEHIISNILNDAIILQQEKLLIKPKNGKIAICGCLEGELHEIGIKCVRNVLESEGWKVFYTGPNLPIGSFTKSIENIKPDLICVSITYPNSEKDLQINLKQLLFHAQNVNAKLMVGGIGLELLENTFEYSDFTAHSTNDLINQLNKL
jgi:excisionase family DNA binding protein